MFYEKKVDQITSVGIKETGLYPIKREVPTRPALFSFLAHLAHIVLGYRVANVFIMNFILSTLLLFLTYILVLRLTNKEIAISTSIFIISHPIISLSFTSGGYEILFGVVITLTLLSMKYFFEQPSTESAKFLLANLFLTAHSRHEAFIYPIVIITVLLWLKESRRYVISAFVSPLGMCMLVFGVIPEIWHKIAAANAIHKIVLVSEKTPFHMVHLVKHSGLFLIKAFSLSDDWPYANIIIIGGIGGIGFILVDILKNVFKSRRVYFWPNFFYLLTSLTLAIYWAIVTSFYLGNPTHSNAGRYYMLACLVLSIFCSLFLARLLKTLKHRSILTILFAIVIFMVYHPVAVKNAIYNRVAPWVEFHAVEKFINSIDNKNILFISTKPRNLVIFNIGSISFQYANALQNQLLSNLKSKNIKDIYVLQRLSDQGAGLLKGYHLNDRFVLQPIIEWELDPWFKSRISRVINYES